AAFVAVHTRVVRARGTDERRSPGPGVVTGAGAFDLDDGGAEIGQEHRGERAGQHSAEIRDQHSGEWTGSPNCGPKARVLVALFIELSRLCHTPLPSRSV